jgi:DNA polymerase-1
MRGLPIDMAYAEALEKEMDGKLLDIEERLAACDEVKRYTRKYGTFSPTNTDHVLVLMRDICQRDEVLTEDRDGNRKETTNEGALALIPRDEVPSASLILEHRGIEKISGTYLRPTTSRKFVYPDDMLHCTYSSMTAETGRLAAEDPSAQNWPIRKHREVRGIIYVGGGRWIVAFDYGQIEFRVAGMASGDENLIKACWTGYDVHGYWAKRMVEEYPEIKDWIVGEFDVDWDEKGMKTLRQEAKNKWVFPSIFGASMHSRGANLHLPKEVTQRLDAEFWEDFPDVKKWQKRTIAFYEKHLYVETLGGIRRHGPLTTNQIINMPIQGTAAEIVTEGMCAVSEMAVLENDMDMHPMLNVHDDLTFNMPDEGMERRIDRIATEMCRPRFKYINVPLIVEVKVGERWSQMEEIKVYRSNELFNTPNPYKD